MTAQEVKLVHWLRKGPKGRCIKLVDLKLSSQMHVSEGYEFDSGELTHRIVPLAITKN